MARYRPSSDWLQLQKALDGRTWPSILQSFSSALRAEGVVFEDLPVQVGFSAEDAFEEVTWFAWWRREKVAERTEELAQKYKEKRFTEVALHGARARIGELRTVALLSEAAERGDGALASVLMLAFLGSPGFGRAIEAKLSWPMQLVSAQMHRWAHDHIMQSGIDPYWLPNTTSRLPQEPVSRKEVASVDDYVAAVAGYVGDNLRSWAPVALTIRPTQRLTYA